jgi:ABC-type Fe3+ transport system permease subunit
MKTVTSSDRRVPSIKSRRDLSRLHNKFLHKIGGTWIFWMFGIVLLLFIIFIYFFVPEIKGVSLVEIESNLRNGVTSRAF